MVRKSFNIMGYILGTLFMAIVVLIASMIMGILMGGIEPAILVAFLALVFGSSYLIIRRDPVRNFQKIIIASIVVILFEITVIGAVTIFSTVGLGADLLVVLAAVVLIYEVLKVDARVRKLYRQAQKCKLEEVEKYVPVERKGGKSGGRSRKKRRKQKPKKPLRDVLSREEKGSEYD